MLRQGCHLYIFAASADKLRVHGTGRCTCTMYMREYKDICGNMQYIYINMYIYLYVEHVIYIHV